MASSLRALTFALACGSAAAGAGAQTIQLEGFGLDAFPTGFVGLTVGSGARALGMGGAFLAIADDGTAASWNPAGLCVLERPEASVVFDPRARVTYGFASQRVDGGDVVSLLQEHSTDLARRGLDFASAAYPFRLGRLKLVPQLSYQRAIGQDNTRRTPPFARVDRSPSGGDLAEITNSQEARFTGGLDVYTVSLGVGLSTRVYLGASLNLWRNGTAGEIEDRQALPSRNEPVILERRVRESFEGRNATIGALLKPSRRAQVGLVLKTPFGMSYRFRETAGGLDFGAAGRVNWPRALGGGVAVFPIEPLALSVDYTQTRWSAARLVREAGESSGWPSGRQADTRQLRFGTEYVIKAPRLLGLTAIPVRTGYARDRQHFRNFDGSGVTFSAVSAGLGLVWSRASFDLAYVRERGEYFDRATLAQNPVGEDAFATVSGPTRFRSGKLLASLIARF